MDKRKLFTNVVFSYGISGVSNLPNKDIPEFAFLGRSNVGKSSLINKLAYRKSLVKVSCTPGRTQQVNYFLVNDSLYLVDLPGYGYAKTSKQTSNLINDSLYNYLTASVQLRVLYLLIDARRGILDIDLSVIDLLEEHSIVNQVVLTKIDKISAGDLSTLLETSMNMLSGYNFTVPCIIATSVTRNINIGDLRQNIVKNFSEYIT